MFYFFAKIILNLFMRNIDWNYLLDKSLNLKTHNGDYSIRVPNLENLRNKKIFDLSKVLNEEDIKKLLKIQNLMILKLQINSMMNYLK